MLFGDSPILCVLAKCFRGGRLWCIETNSNFMKEDAPQEVEGVDVTNVPKEGQSDFFRWAERLKKIQGKLTATEKEWAVAEERHDTPKKRVLLGQFEPLLEKEEFVSGAAREHVAPNKDIDIKAVHAEMERALAKQREEGAEQEAIVKDIREKLG